MPREIETKTILNKTKRRDPWFLDDYTLNPYSACSFNCLYCYIRGSKYGENLANSISVKKNAPELLEKQLSNKAKRGQHGIIVLSSATDPYLKLEKEYELTRKLLEIILKYRFPVHIITKSDLVLRDLDLLEEISHKAILPLDLQWKLKGGAFVTFSFSTLDDQEAAIFEPGATSPTLRLKALHKIKKSQLKTGVSLMPLLPYITDTPQRVEAVFKTFKDEQIDYLFPATLTLFGNDKADSKTLMFRAIAKHYPELIRNYESLFAAQSSSLGHYRATMSKLFLEMQQKYEIRDSLLS